MLCWKWWKFRLLILNWSPWSMSTFVSFSWKMELFFSPSPLWLMSGNNSDPVKKSVLARPQEVQMALAVSLRLGSGATVLSTTLFNIFLLEKGNSLSTDYWTMKRKAKRMYVATLLNVFYKCNWENKYPILWKWWYCRLVLSFRVSTRKKSEMSGFLSLKFQLLVGRWNWWVFGVWIAWRTLNSSFTATRYFMFHANRPTYRAILYIHLHSTPLINFHFKTRTSQKPHCSFC